MLDRVARYETMRMAADRRYGLWATVLSIRPRLPGYQRETLRAAAVQAVRQLEAEGMIYLFSVPGWFWRERRLGPAEIEPALADRRYWRPRSCSVRKLVRIGITPQGWDAFERGDFGEAMPVVSQRRIPWPPGRAADGSDIAAATVVAVLAGIVGGGICGWVFGSFWESLIPQAAWLPGLVPTVSMVLGAGCAGVVSGGLAYTLTQQANLRAADSATGDLLDGPEEPEDHFWEGPTLDSRDEFGDERW